MNNNTLTLNSFVVVQFPIHGTARFYERSGHITEVRGGGFVRIKCVDGSDCVRHLGEVRAWTPAR